jgi:hypothetical protein
MFLRSCQRGVDGAVNGNVDNVIDVIDVNGTVNDDVNEVSTRLSMGISTDCQWDVNGVVSKLSMGCHHSDINTLP